MATETLAALSYIALALLPITWALVAEQEFKRLFLLLSMFFTALGSYSLYYILDLEYPNAAYGVYYIFLTLCAVLGFVVCWYGILAIKWCYEWLREASRGVSHKWRARG